MKRHNNIDRGGERLHFMYAIIFFIPLVGLWAPVLSCHALMVFGKPCEMVSIAFDVSSTSQYERLNY